MQNLLRTAEGGLNAIQDNLQRIRELTIQMGSGILTDSDRRIIANEIEMLSSGIGDTARQVQFNNKNLLDGSAGDLHTAVSADGSGPSFRLADMSDLGDEIRAAIGNLLNDNIHEFLETVDQALSNVSEARAELGAASNRLDHTINSNSITMLNQMAAKSRIADADIAKSVTENSRDQVLNDMQILMQQQRQEQQRVNTVQLLM
jgi:flagellin